MCVCVCACVCVCVCKIHTYIHTQRISISRKNIYFYTEKRSAEIRVLHGQ